MINITTVMSETKDLPVTSQDVKESGDAPLTMNRRHPMWSHLKFI